MPNKLTVQEFIEKANAIHKNKYDYSLIAGVHSMTKITILCYKCNNLFKQLPHEHLNKERGCRKCYGAQLSNVNEFILKANIIHKNAFKYHKFLYLNAKTKSIIICKMGHEFFQSANAHLQGYGCSICSGTYKYSKDEFIKIAAKKFNNKYIYGYYKIINGQLHIEITCPEHGTKYVYFKTHLNSSVGCKDCNRLTTDEFISRAIKIHNGKYKYPNTKYISSKINVLIECDIHGEFRQLPYGHLEGKGCSLCTKNISHKERKFLNYLNIKEENRQLKKLIYTVDGCDPTTNTIYEFLGDFWHGNPEIHKLNEVNRVTKDTFGELNNFIFNIKFKDLTESGYKIKYIWENDWDKYIKDPSINPKLQEH